MPQANGEFTTTKGKAKIVDKKTNPKLKVAFFWPLYDDYWILDLGLLRRGEPIPKSSSARTRAIE